MADGRGLLGLVFRKKEEAKPVDEGGFVEPNLPKDVRFGDRNAAFKLGRIKYKGLYDLDKLYKFMANWLRQMRFEVHENLYKSKPPELEIRMRAERKITGFVMEVVTIYYHSWGEYDIEVVQNGKKKKMTRARMILEIGGDIVAPYNDIFGRQRWVANKAEVGIFNIFRNWFFKREIESVYWDTLYYELWRFHSAIKEVLKQEASGNVW